MGYAYEILSTPAASQSNSRVFDFVRKWLLCGWIQHLDGDGEAAATAQGASSSGDDGYVRPPSWKRLLRRVRAKTRKVQDACSEGLCFTPSQQQQLNYQSMDSYKKNFDDGRDDYYYGAKLQQQQQAGPCDSPILWEDVAIDFSAGQAWQQSRGSILVAAA